MIGKSDRVGDLYILHSDILASHSSANSTTVVNHVQSISPTLWHNCLGHLSYKKLGMLKDVLCCDVSKAHKASPSYVCPLAKQRRLSFTSNNHVAHSPFDLVHCDIWGPYHVVSYTCHNYFLTLVDDCTRLTWVYLLKQKSDAAVVIPRFFNMVATQFQSSIKEFRSDNAIELVFTEFFHEKGVLHQFSCVERPEQNSVVERKHQHLLNVARALFFFTPGFLYLSRLTAFSQPPI